MASREGRRPERGPVVAGVELAAGSVRAVVGQREEARLRVGGVGQSALSADAISGGLVTDRRAVAAAVQSAMALAQGRERPSRIVAALDGDDVRTFHLVTTFEREAIGQTIAAGEVNRAVSEARAEAERGARDAATDDPSLRGVATVQLRGDVAGFALDGRPLTEGLHGLQGRFVDVRTDVSLAPLLLAGAANAALGSAKLRAGLVSGAYALGRLAAECGLADAGVLRLGADVTAYAILRQGRVVATRTFGLGRDALLARDADREGDARTWALCVLARIPGLDGELPASWRFIGVPDALISLPQALGDAIVASRGGSAEIAPLRTSAATRIVSSAPLQPDDLVACGAAALAAELYS